MKKLKIFFNSIHTKLYLSFLFIMIPLILAQFLMYFLGTKAIKNEMEYAASANVIYLRDNFVSNIKAINSQLEFLLND
jgi:hypothetical protein